MFPPALRKRQQTKSKTKENIMKKTSVNMGKTLKVLGLVIGLGALPLLLGVTGCTTGSRYEQSTGERIDDHGTSSRVRAALADDSQYKYDGVNVETFKGVVQLSGFVDTKDQKNRAGDLARKVKGVTDVENNITVKE
jgi:hypothetical protein